MTDAIVASLTGNEDQGVPVCKTQGVADVTVAPVPDDEHGGMIPGVTRVTAERVSAPAGHRVTGPAENEVIPVISIKETAAKSDTRVALTEVPDHWTQANPVVGPTECETGQHINAVKVRQVKQREILGVRTFVIKTNSPTGDSLGAIIKNI